MTAGWSRSRSESRGAARRADDPGRGPGVGCGPARTQAGVTVICAALPDTVPGWPWAPVAPGPEDPPEMPPRLFLPPELPEPPAPPGPPGPGWPAAPGGAAAVVACTLARAGRGWRGGRRGTCRAEDVEVGGAGAAGTGAGQGRAGERQRRALAHEVTAEPGLLGRHSSGSPGPAGSQVSRWMMRISRLPQSRPSFSIAVCDPASLKLAFLPGGAEVTL